MPSTRLDCWRRTVLGCACGARGRLAPVRGPKNSLHHDDKLLPLAAGTTVVSLGALVETVELPSCTLEFLFWIAGHGGVHAPLACGLGACAQRTGCLGTDHGADAAR